jgi:hypothetical protein
MHNGFLYIYSHLQYHTLLNPQKRRRQVWQSKFGPAFDAKKTNKKKNGKIVVQRAFSGSGQKSGMSKPSSVIFAELD